MSGARRRPVKCYCPHTCGSSGQLIHPFMARSHLEKTLREQSRDRAAAAATTSTSTSTARAPLPGRPSEPALSATLRIPVRTPGPPAAQSTAEQRIQDPGSNIQPLATAPLSPLFSEARSATSPRSIPTQPATPQPNPEDDFILLCDSPIRSQDLLELVATQETLNAAAAASAVPLTQHVASTVPKPTEIERRVTRAYQRELDRAQREDEQDPDAEDELADVDGGYVSGDDEDSVLGGGIDETNDEDDPDPFRAPDDPNDAPLLPFLEPIIRTVYTVVEWLHGQWHLARSPCHTLLHVFAYVFFFLGRPDLQQQTFVTVKSLEAILSQPGVETACDAWRRCQRGAGTYRDVFDGEVVRNLKAHDGTLFWRNGPDCLASGPEGELRLGVMWGIDWFSHIVSNTAPSHSSCPTSFSIANLPLAQRFRTSNLICTSVLPGPKEQSGDEVQRFIRPIISDLVRLWKEGVLISTPSCPDGRRVRVILLALVCDKPAAHKVGGFGSHTHTYFCHCCWCKRDDMASPEAFERDGFDKRTDARQRELGEQYRRLSTKAERKAFVKEHATRYTQLSRLPYFDLVQQVVIDPMHNLALGLVKTQFYHIWVQCGILNEAKLRELHDLIATCEVPGYLGRLPKEIGVPAGGSLTADQWIILATIMGPLALWSDVLDRQQSTVDRRAAVARFEEQKRAAAEAHAAERVRVAEERQNEASASQAAGSKRKRAPKPKVAPDVPFTMHPDDPGHFLKLTNALHILLRYELTDETIDEAERLLREYTGEIVSTKLYGTSQVRPNHHYATHVADYARAFGPLCGFWTFLFERLNRVLKSFNTNNHGNGEIETTFFTEFLRTCSTSRLVYQMLHTPEGTITNLCAVQMLKATHDERGTVAGLAQLASDAEQENEDFVCKPSRAYRTAAMSSDLYAAVLLQLRQIAPHIPLYNILSPRPIPNAAPLFSQATFFEHAVVRGRRYHASAYLGNTGKSLVSVNVSTTATPVMRVGEITHIFSFAQPGFAEVYFWAHVRWFMPHRLTVIPTPWSGKYVLLDPSSLWKVDTYDSTLPPLIDVMSIRNHVARMPVQIDETTLWATIGIDKAILNVTVNRSCSSRAI
ncbi:hypothetical protein EXIGLDRAFT_692440 [Exidia glandulosa HHB12029]|uniref:Transposase domain-containing protein n=1 Tax=Exidia glandulosa HHB12029 TaxID=1314781 RepID=A0A165I038_EXIGL|nr:hypothetical protein EXIGLDRAFT_692440 [Exidia glandulosa HHB12029]